MLATVKNGPSTMLRPRHDLVYEVVKSMSIPTRQETVGTTGTLIRKVREQRGLKQAELAERAGLNPSAISQFETGQREPSSENLCKLADALGVTVDYLLGREEPKPSGSQLKKVLLHAQNMSQRSLDELEQFAAFLATKDKKK